MTDTMIVIGEMGGPEAAERAGVSYRQLDYWARTGLIEPAVPAQGSGSRRLYSARDVRRLQAVSALLDAGFDLRRIRAVMDAVLDEITDDAVGLIVVGSLSRVAHSREEMIDALEAGDCVLPLVAEQMYDDGPWP